MSMNETSYPKHETYPTMVHLKPPEFIKAGATPSTFPFAFLFIYEKSVSYYNYIKLMNSYLVMIIISSSSILNRK